MFCRFLSLLIALPLLLPQGLCVCGFALSCEACTSEPATAEAAPRCCNCHAHQAVAENDVGKVSVAKDHTCHKSGPNKCDDRAPACPTKNATSYWRADIGQAATPLTLDCMVSLPLEGFLADVSRACTVPLTVHQSDRPIYLTTLSLLI